MADEGSRVCSKCGEEPTENVLGARCLEQLEGQGRTSWQQHEVALQVPAARGAAPEAYVKAV